MEKPASRILIVGSGTLFDEGLSRLLALKSPLEVFSITYTDDEAFLESFARYQPETIVLFEGGPLSISRVFDLLRDIPNPVNWQVITVLADTNTVDVFKKQQVVARGSDDLLTLIQR